LARRRRKTSKERGKGEGAAKKKKNYRTLGSALKKKQRTIRKTQVGERGEDCFGTTGRIIKSVFPFCRPRGKEEAEDWEKYTGGILLYRCAFNALDGAGKRGEVIQKKEEEIYTKRIGTTSIAVLGRSKGELWATSINRHP